jgi:hypothetical protein
MCKKKINRKEKYLAVCKNEEIVGEGKIDTLTSKELHLFCSEMCYKRFFKEDPNFF